MPNRRVMPVSLFDKNPAILNTLTEMALRTEAKRREEEERARIAAERRQRTLAYAERLKKRHSRWV